MFRLPLMSQVFIWAKLYAGTHTASALMANTMSTPKIRVDVFLNERAISVCWINQVLWSDELISTDHFTMVYIQFYRMKHIQYITYFYVNIYKYHHLQLKFISRCAISLTKVNAKSKLNTYSFLSTAGCRQLIQK